MDSITIKTTELFDTLINSINIPPSIPENFAQYLNYLPLFLLGFIAAIILTPIAGYIAERFGITDNPAEEREHSNNRYDNPERHIHKGKMPFLGGYGIMLPILLSILLLFVSNPIIIIVVLVIIILIVLGTFDDIYNVPATRQMAVQVIAATIIAFSIINLTQISNPFGGTIDLEWTRWVFNIASFPFEFIFPGDLLIIPWILLCINAVKWVGGSDGLLESNMIIAYFLIFILGVRDHNLFVIITSIILAGGSAGFLIFNFPPAKVFTGSVGKTLHGFLIALLAIISGAKFATVLLLLALPVVDSLFVIIKRYFKHKPKNLAEVLRMNDTNHLHFRLRKLDFTPKQILLIESGITLVLASFAAWTTGATTYLFLLIFILAVISLLIFVHLRVRKKREEAPKKKETPESKYSY